MTSALAPHHLRQRVGRLLEDRARRSTWDARAAVVLLESLARLPIGSAYFHHVAGILHAAAGRHARAVACQERALRAGPGRHAAAMHGRRGMSEFRLGEHAAAEASFRGAIETGDPRASGYWLGLVQAMTRLGRRTEAERALVDAALAVPGVDGRPGVPLAWYIFEGGWGRDSLADDLGEVVRRYPGAEEPMISLSLMENARGRIAEGTDLMQRAAALHWPFPGAAGSRSSKVEIAAWRRITLDITIRDDKGDITDRVITGHAPRGGGAAPRASRVADVDGLPHREVGFELH